MEKLIVTALLIGLVSQSLLAVDGKKVQYVGGTLTGIKEGAEGTIDTTHDTALKVDAKKDGAIEIPYAAITELEYGQKAGRRVGVAIMISPIALFSKKRKHFLTVSYKDQAGKEQAAVLEVGKDIVRTILKVVETRSGKPIQFQDDEARKSIGGGK